MTKRPKAPKHLALATRKWWLSVVEQWTLEEHHIHLLTLAAEALDRCEQARQVIEREGLTVATRDGGSKLHPACRVEIDSRLAYARMLRELDLDVTAPAEASARPPALRSITGGR